MEVVVKTSRHSRCLVWVIFSLAMTSARASAGQDVKGGEWFTRVGFTPARVIATNPFTDSETPRDQQINWTPGISVEIGRQTNGSREWHHLYGLPAYGFGFSLTSLGNDFESARPLDAYGFFSWPFMRLSERAHITS